jgi:N-acetylmuramoyl-L-alanine amidase
VLDETTRRVLSAFQMRYRPANHDGLPDAETAALVRVLITPPEQRCCAARDGP